MVSTAVIPILPIDLRLLGPLTVTVGGVLVPAGGPRQVAVLARLMLTPGQVVSMDQLVDSVWDGDEPAQPNVAIRSYVSNLRRAIEPDRRRRAADSCLASAPPGYLLAIDPAAVDWVRFERLVDEGRVRLSTGDYRQAIDNFRRADSLWRGDPCSGLPDSQVFLAHRGRMTKLRETAVELLFEALLHRGDHSLVANEVEAAIAEHPLRERLTELGMIAFYRAGRQSEALGLGQKLRARLVEGLGIDPSPAIEAMELKILNHDSSLDAPRGGWSGGLQPSMLNPIRENLPTPIRPGLLTNDGGSHSGSSCEFADAALRPVGRDEELAALERIGQAVMAGRSATAVITGEQGIGKTTLATAAAEALDDDAVTVAWCRNRPEEASPLWPWAQLVLSLMEQRHEADPIDVTQDLAPLAALGPSVYGVLTTDLLPDTSATPEDATDSPQTDPLVGGSVEDGLARVGLPEIMLAITRLLERLSRTKPLVLVFEDLHWADAATVTVLNYATRTLTDSQVGFVLTWRDLDMNGSPAVTGLRELSGLPRLIRLELGGLDASAVSELARAGGQSLIAAESAAVATRCGGNPLLIRELLANPDGNRSGVRSWSTLVDIVRDRVDHIHPEAETLLSAAALFRKSFTIGGLVSVSGIESDTAKLIVNNAVRGGMLIDVDPTAGSYGFRHPLVAEVLATQSLAAERAVSHRAAGHHLVTTGGASHEAAFHLSQSPAGEDRLQSARLALDAVNADFDATRLREVDRFVGVGMTASESAENSAGEPMYDGFMIDASIYLSWRAWVDGRPAQWLEDGRAGLDRAVSLHDEFVAGRTSPRQRVPSMASNRGVPADLRHRSQSVDRLSRCVMNLIGTPDYPVGPTQTESFAPLPPSVVQQLAALAESFPVDHPARWSLQLHLGYLDAQTKPGTAGQAKAIREAQKQVSNARRRLGEDGSASVHMAMVVRFSDAMEPSARLSALSEIAAGRNDITSRLFTTRYSYPALLELGRSHEAELLVEEMLSAVSTTGDPIQVAEARLLWIRHLLWTGQVEYASQDLDRAFTEWAELGLAEPVALVRQRRTVRLLNGTPVASGHGPDSHDQLLAERAGAPERAVRLARIGDSKRAVECLEATLDTMAVRQVCLADQALVAMAAALLGHEKAAVTVHELLRAVGDKPVVRPDASVIFGPASLYAGLAAGAAGLDEAAVTHIESAKRAVQRFGGSPAALNAVVNGMRQTQNN